MADISCSTQADLRDALGGDERARHIGELFSRERAADAQFSKLIHSTLDMDRLDYLLRDARAAGVPYGEIDLNYLLNSIRFSQEESLLGIDAKAISAAEQFLMARHFMHRVVYYHKTTFGFEEAARQLLRRTRDRNWFGIPIDGKAVKDICAGPNLGTFTDGFVDQIIQQAAASTEDSVIQQLGKTIATRHRPRLLWEESGWYRRTEDGESMPDFFAQWCRTSLKDIATRIGIAPGIFLIAGIKPLAIEERPAQLSRKEHADLPPQEWEELIYVFPKGGGSPEPLVERKHTLVHELADRHFLIQRLYLVDVSPDVAEAAPELIEAASKWRMK